MNIVEALHDEEAKLQRQLTAVKECHRRFERWQPGGCIAMAQHQLKWNKRQENDVRCYSSENISEGKGTMGEYQG